MFDLQIRNSENEVFLIQLGRVSWLVLALYIVFIYGGLHPNKVATNFLGMYCSDFIILVNFPSIWKIIVELLRNGNIEAKLIILTFFQVSLPLLLIN